MATLLDILVEKFDILGVKLELETEYFNQDLLNDFSSQVKRVDVPLIVKLGGASSIQDVRLSKEVGASCLVAPMVESSYTIEKFVKTVNNIHRENRPKLLINIETKNAMFNLDDIASKFDLVDGIVFGRSDMCSSLGLDASKVNSSQFLNYARKLSNLCEKMDKMFVVGGAITEDSMDFLADIPYLTAFETRKIIFPSEIMVDAQMFVDALNVAMNFEIAWLEHKRDSGFASEEDAARIAEIKERCNKTLRSVADNYKDISENLMNKRKDKRNSSLKGMMQESFFHGASIHGTNFIA